MTKVFVNGCFDCFHDAHRGLLARALELTHGDKLTISLNTDNSIYESKGPGRPYVSMAYRIFAVQGFVNNWCGIMRCYPYVNYTCHNTEEELLTRIIESKAEILIHGDDITDVSKITGFGHIGILIVPRGKDENGNDISTTGILEAE